MFGDECVTFLLTQALGKHQGDQENKLGVEPIQSTANPWSSPIEANIAPKQGRKKALLMYGRALDITASFR